MTLVCSTTTLSTKIIATRFQIGLQGGNKNSGQDEPQLSLIKCCSKVNRQAATQTDRQILVTESASSSNIQYIQRSSK